MRLSAFASQPQFGGVAWVRDSLKQIGAGQTLNNVHRAAFACARYVHAGFLEVEGV